MSTSSAKERNINEVRMIINGELDFETLKYPFKRKSFGYYIKRFIAEKLFPNDLTEDTIESITFEQTKEYIESIIDNYSTDSKPQLQELFSNQLKRDIRKAFSYDDDCIRYKNAMQKLIENEKAFERFSFLSKKARKSDDEKKEIKELKIKYDIPEKRRKFTRKSLMDLFFLLDCNVDEAIDLLHRLGEQSFYSRSRKEMLVWWSLKQENDRYGKYLELKNLLDEPQIEINFSNFSTGELIKKFTKCKSDFEFANIIRQLNPDGGNRESTKREYFAIIEKINKTFNDYFRSKVSNNKIVKWNEEIEEYAEKLFVEGITKREQTIYSNAIDDRNLKIIRERNENYNRIKKKPAVSILNKRFNEFIKDENINIDGVADLIRINNNSQNENAKISREDIIIALFVSTVLEEFYVFDNDELNSSCKENKLGSELFDDTMLEELEESDITEIIEHFQAEADGCLMKLDFMPLNFLNEFECYLILCLASGNPLKNFCRVVNVFEMYDYE